MNAEKPAVVKERPGSPVLRSERELIAATRPFLAERPALGWFHVISTLAALLGFGAVAVFAPWLWLRLTAGVAEGLVTLRMFVLYHDYMHGAFLRDSLAARLLFHAWGLVSLTPARPWRETHNHHHAHTAQLVGSHIGSYLTATVDEWRAMSRGERLRYRLIRHPLTMIFGYFTVFVFGMCVGAFLRRPRQNWDALVSLGVHAAGATAVGLTLGLEAALVAWFLPSMVAAALGAYLFYVQHNFPEVTLRSRADWTYVGAALDSSSYLRTGPVMGWVTANIGYHHVHHVNPTIPFYRLPEAMASMPELQSPSVTSLRPRDVLAAFRQKLWDPARGRMVTYAEAARG